MSARIAVVGDLDPKNPTHAFTNASLEHVGLAFERVGTDAIEGGRGVSRFTAEQVRRPVAPRCG
jgi:hypothetical protein